MIEVTDAHINGLLLRRDIALARRNLLDYARLVFPRYQINWHHRDLAYHLEAVESGELTRLEVSMPPRHGKSLLCSIIFPCWVLGRQPGIRIAQCAYAADLAKDHSIEARAIIRGQEHAEAFPPPESWAGPKIDQVKEWEAPGGGTYKAVGVGGGITGKGVNLGLIDDPLKDRMEADSEIVRRAVLHWYRSTFYTRLEKELEANETAIKMTGSIIMVMTRWHMDDLAGVVLEEMKDGGDQWETVIFPAFGEPDRRRKTFALWPEKRSESELLQIQKAIGDHEWSALFMQEPVLRGGNRIKVEGIHWHEDDTDFPDMQEVRAWDLASSEKERDKDDPDFTWAPLMGLTFDEEGAAHLWIRHMEFGQWEAPERNRRILACAERDGPRVWIGVEAVAGYKDTYTQLAEMLHGTRRVDKVRIPGDKSAHVALIEPIFDAGHVHIVDGPWRTETLRQLAGFPSAVHDDCPDSIALGVTMLHPELRGVQPVFPALCTSHLMKGAASIVPSHSKWLLSVEGYEDDDGNEIYRPITLTRVIVHGITNEATCLWAAIDEDADWLIYRMWRQAGWHARDCAGKIAELSGDETFTLDVIEVPGEEARGARPLDRQGRLSDEYRGYKDDKNKRPLRRLAALKERQSAATAAIDSLGHMLSAQRASDRPKDQWFSQRGMGLKHVQRLQKDSGLLISRDCPDLYDELRDARFQKRADGDPAAKAPEDPVATRSQAVDALLALIRAAGSKRIRRRD